MNKVEEASLDMSPSFISGVMKYFPKAEIHFDRFHVVKLLNEAMDKVRISEKPAPLNRCREFGQC